MSDTAASRADRVSVEWHMPSRSCRAKTSLGRPQACPSQGHQRNVQHWLNLITGETSAHLIVAKMQAMYVHAESGY